MTGEEFRSLYRLGERLTKPPVVTHRATDISGGPVLVHFLLEESAESGKGDLERVSSLGATEGRMVREVIEVEGRSVVVTEVLEGFSTFQEWLDRAAPTELPPEKPAAEDPGKSQPGAYTQLFKVPEADADSSTTGAAGTTEEASAPEPPAPESSEATSPPDPPEEEGAGTAPGSYTMLFGGGSGSEDRGEEAVSATQGFPGPGAPPPPEAPRPPVPQDPPPAPEPPPPPKPPSATGSPSAPVFPAPEPPPPPDPKEAAGLSETPHAGEEGSAGLSETPHAGEEGSAGLSETPHAREEGAAGPPPADTPAEAPGPPPGKGSDGKPGAYTQVFGRPSPEGGPSPSQQPPPGYSAVPPSPKQPGSPARPSSPEASTPDWQRWRDTPGAAGRHIPSDDYLRRLGGSSSSIPGSTTPPSPSTPGHGQSPPPSSDPFGGGDLPTGPGHYTMIRKGFSPDPGPPPPAARPSAGAGPRDSESKPATMPSRKSSLLTILALVAVFLTIVAMVILFATFG